MRRTGKVLVSPATAIAACGGAGMTNEALMNFLGLRRKGCSVEVLSRCADRGQRRRRCFAMLQTEERRIAPAAPQQIVMAAALDDLAAFDHQNGVGVHDGVQAVGDDNGGAVLAKVLDRL